MPRDINFKEGTSEDIKTLSKKVRDFLDRMGLKQKDLQQPLGQRQQNISAAFRGESDVLLKSIAQWLIDNKGAEYEEFFPESRDSKFKINSRLEIIEARLEMLGIENKELKDLLNLNLTMIEKLISATSQSSKSTNDLRKLIQSLEQTVKSNNK